MEVSTNHFLKFVPFSKFDLWDTKRYTSKSVNSNFEVVKLSSCINEESNKYKLFLEEEKDFGILGVNNKTGIFDAYVQKGKDINQPYKKMEIGWIAYNPYRINVGSIGIRLEEHKNEYISPAYVVFSCKENILPEYLFLVFKTDTFNKVINENTTGSVRQNLSFDKLKDLEIPLPTLQEQQEIVEAYFSKINEANQLKLEANQQINNLDLELGIYTSKNIFKTNVINIINYYELDKWGVDKNQLSSVNYNGKFQVLKIKDICLIGSGGTPSRSRKEYYNGTIPWIKTGEVLDDIIYDTEEKITIEAINNSSAKLYKKDSIIIAMYGQGKTRGRTAKLGIDATTNQACAVLYSVNNQVIVNDYLWIFLINEYDRIRELASGNSQPNLNADMIKNYPIVVPPLENQKEIISKYWEFDKIKKLKIKNAEQLKHQANEEFEKAIFQ